MEPREEVEGRGKRKAKVLGHAFNLRVQEAEAG